MVEWLHGHGRNGAGPEPSSGGDSPAWHSRRRPPYSEIVRGVVSMVGWQALGVVRDLPSSTEVVGIRAAVARVEPTDTGCFVHFLDCEGMAFFLDAESYDGGCVEPDCVQARFGSAEITLYRTGDRPVIVDGGSEPDIDSTN